MKHRMPLGVLVCLCVAWVALVPVQAERTKVRAMIWGATGAAMGARLGFDANAVQYDFGRAWMSLGRIPVRTRVLVGERDVVAPAEELGAALSPAAALEVLPGLNHFFSRAAGAGRAAADLLVPALDRAIRALL